MPRSPSIPLKYPISSKREIPHGRQRRTPHRLRVGALTLPLYKLVEPTLLQQLVQPLVERMCHRPRPLRVGNPKLFLRLPLLRSSSHRHARSLRTSALDYARNFTSESRLSPRTARSTEEFLVCTELLPAIRKRYGPTFALLEIPEILRSDGKAGEYGTVYFRDYV